MEKDIPLAEGSFGDRMNLGKEGSFGDELPPEARVRPESGSFYIVVPPVGEEKVPTVYTFSSLARAQNERMHLLQGETDAEWKAMLDSIVFFWVAVTDRTCKYLVSGTYEVMDDDGKTATVDVSAILPDTWKKVKCRAANALKLSKRTNAVVMHGVDPFSNYDLEILLKYQKDGFLSSPKEHHSFRKMFWKERNKLYPIMKYYPGYYHPAIPPSAEEEPFI